MSNSDIVQQLEDIEAMFVLTAHAVEPTGFTPSIDTFGRRLAPVSVAGMRR